MKLVKEFLKDRYTLWLMRFTLLTGLFLSTVKNIAGYFFLTMFAAWYIAVIVVENYFPTVGKDNFSKNCTIYKKPKKIENFVTVSGGEIDPLFLEDVELKIE